MDIYLEAENKHFSISAIIKWSNVLIWQIQNPILYLKYMHHKSCSSLHACTASLLCVFGSVWQPQTRDVSCQCPAYGQRKSVSVQTPKSKRRREGKVKPGRWTCTPIWFITSTFHRLQRIKSSPVPFIWFLVLQYWSEVCCKFRFMLTLNLKGQFTQKWKFCHLLSLK